MDNISELIENKLEISIEDLINKIKSEKAHNVRIRSLFKRGKIRCVLEVDKDTLLYRLQTILLRFFSSKTNFPDYVFGFQKQKSYYKFLDVHTSDNVETCFLKLDIQDFFYSLNAKKLVAQLVLQFEQKNDNHSKIKELLSETLTYNNRIPQGFKTSPFLSNYYFFKADLRIKKYCDKVKIKYSRYADDMIFSSPVKNKIYSNNTIRIIEVILKDFSLKLNKAKTKFSKTELCLNGYVIRNEIKLSINKLKEIKRILFIIEQTQTKEEFNSKYLLTLINNQKHLSPAKNTTKRYFTEEYLKNYLSGYRSFLISFVKENTNNQQWNSVSKKIISRIEKAILIIYNSN